MPSSPEQRTELLDIIQNEFPLTERPYAAFAERLGTSEQDVIDTITELRDDRQIRQVGAIFDTRRLGYTSSLVAARSVNGNADEAAEIINGHPGVSHNYLRDHEFDLWFTVAVPPDSQLGLDRTIELLGELAGVEAIRPLPTLKFFRIGVDLDVRGGRDPGARKPMPKPSLEGPKPGEITERRKAAIRALQVDLPATERPFRELAEHEGFTEAELLELGHEMLRDGTMRRFAAVLFHRNAGFTWNGMGVWNVPEERREEVGQVMGTFQGVSHCYQRPTYEDWPYSIFSMTHGRSKDECEAVLAAIAEATGIDDYTVLYSTKEYKKIRVSYFTPEIYAWEAAHAPLALA